MKNLSYIKNLFYDDVKVLEERKMRNSIQLARLMKYQQLIPLLRNNNVKTIEDNLEKIQDIIKALYESSGEMIFRFKNGISNYKSATTEKEKKDAQASIKITIQKIIADYRYEQEGYNIRKANFNLDDLINSRRIISCIKYNQPLSDQQIEYIKDRLLKEDLTNAEVLYLIELCNAHTAKYDSKKQNNGALNLLKQGYEQIIIPSGNFEELIPIANGAIAALDGQELQDAKIVLQSINEYSYERAEYIFSYVLIHYQNEIYQTIAAYKEFGLDPDILPMVKEDHKKLAEKYNVVRDFIIALHNKKKEPKEELDNDEEQIDEGLIKNVYFSTNHEDDPSKAYFIKDLEYNREESIASTVTLLTDFQKGSTARIKWLKGKPKAIELKDDQIRIILRPMGEQDYSVQGVFIKKDDNDPEEYQNYLSRPLAKKDDEYSKGVAEIYNKLVETKARKGTIQ